jgi:hypothetical protein
MVFPRLRKISIFIHNVETIETTLTSLWHTIRIRYDSPSTSQPALPSIIFLSSKIHAIVIKTAPLRSYHLRRRELEF